MMGVPTRHLLHQGPMLGALAQTVIGAVRQRFNEPEPGPVLTPGASVRRELAPPPGALVDDFVRHLGGDPRAYRDQLPPHLFPQWAMPCLVRAMRGLPYPMLRGVNAGCRLLIHAPIPRGERLRVEAHLERVDHDERKVLLHVRGTTSTASVERALEHDLTVAVPLRRASNGAAAIPNVSDERARRSEAPTSRQRGANRVPEQGREVAHFRLASDAGRAFAALTGDVNPIHWLAPYARASGFQSVILHGFGTFAHAAEGLIRGVLAGDPAGLSLLEARFLRPLVLPADVGLYVHDDRLAVGEAPGGPAYMTGHFRKRDAT